MKNSVIEKMKRNAANNSLVIGTMDSVKNKKEQNNDKIATNWEIVVKINKSR